MAVEVPDDRGTAGIRFEKEPEGIGFLQPRAVHTRRDLVLVPLAVAHRRHECLPDAAGAEVVHAMRRSVPAIEIADHAHLLGVGRPHREVHAAGVAHLPAVRAKLVVRTAQRALAEEIQVELGQHARIGTGGHDDEASRKVGSTSKRPSATKIDVPPTRTRVISGGKKGPGSFFAELCGKRSPAPFCVSIEI